jgi:putative restriction endonuclease
VSLAEYTRRLTRLRTDVSAAHYPNQPEHRAPHKPLLLLSVMDLVAEGSVTGNLIEFTPDLVDVFSLYWLRCWSFGGSGSLTFGVDLPFWQRPPRPIKCKKGGIDEMVSLL